jgi:hypothetical protein
MNLLGLMRAFSIRLRMLSAIGVVVVLLLAVGATGLWGMQRLQAVQHHVVEHSLAETAALGRLEVALAEVRRHEERLFFSVAAGRAADADRAAWEAALGRAEQELRAMQEG